MANIFHNRSANYTQSSKFLTRSSRYVGALASFVQDTKPFHSKITDVVEEYQFADNVSVKITETTKTRIHVTGVHTYNYFSAGASGTMTLPVNPLYTAMQAVFERVSASTMMPELNVDYVYAKRQRDAVNEVLIERGAGAEPLVEGIDYFVSKGAFQFKVRQTDDANLHFVPQWVDSRLDGVVTHAVQQARRRGNDLSNTTSALYKTRQLLNAVAGMTLSSAATALLADLLAPITATASAQLSLSAALRTALLSVGVSTTLSGFRLVEFAQARAELLDAAAQTALNNLVIELDKIILPWTNISGDPNFPLNRLNYEPLLNLLTIEHVVPTVNGVVYTAWMGQDREFDIVYVTGELQRAPNNTAKCVVEALAALAPPMYFGVYGEFDIRENGLSVYESSSDDYTTITNMTSGSSAAPSEIWRIVSADDNSFVYNVIGDIAGFVGQIIVPLAGAQFTSTYISFFIKPAAGVIPPLGQTIVFKPTNRIVFDETAPLETWSIIKTAPQAYSRPLLKSTRYGYIVNEVGTVGVATLVGDYFESGTIVLTARAGGTIFDVTHSSTVYSSVATVGVLFNDGHIKFKIVAGSAYHFQEGDRFYIQIKNDPAKAIDLDLGFGFDLDSFDNPDLLYDAAGLPRINFAYDTRYIDYDLTTLNLQVAQSAIGGRKWRITAVPDLSRPIATLKKDGQTAAWVDLQAATSGVAPDPSLTAAALSSMLGDSNTAADITLYYASVFKVEYSDNNFTTVTNLGTVAVGGSFANAAHGISFTLTPGTKPFIAVVTDDLPTGVSGGDVFSFQVENVVGSIEPLPIGLSSGHIPRLVMHGDGFYESEPAAWAVTFTSATDFTVKGVRTVSPGGIIVNAACKLSTGGVSTRENTSYKDDHVHFTIVPGPVGFASGDTFTFATYARKPTWLVHGSASGWQQDAVVGEAYWNGKIGFTINEPVGRLYDEVNGELSATNNVWTLAPGTTSTMTLARLRYDTPTLCYVLTPILENATTIGWIISRADKGIIGRIPLVGTFKDEYVTLVANSAASDARVIMLLVTGDDFDTWAAQDTIILRSPISFKMPALSETLLIDGRWTERVDINLDYSNTLVAPPFSELAAASVDQRFVDLNTGQGDVALSTTSPDTDLLLNWIPHVAVPYDSASSVAEFSDAATTKVIYATGTGAIIGTISNATEPATFTWDADFVSKYLPLNAGANIVIRSRAAEERLNINLSEVFNWFISAGFSSADYMLSDDAVISIVPGESWSVRMTQTDSISSLIGDAQDGTFIPGYDVLPYDYESGGNINATSGYFDLGVPLTSTFMRAKELSLLPSLTTDGQLELAALVVRLNQFLVNNSITQTELPDFLGLVDAYVAAHAEEATVGQSGFGYPTSGLAVGSTMRDSLLFTAINIDNGLPTAILHSNTLPIGQTVPNPVIIDANTTYETFITCLSVPTPVKQVQISFLWTSQNYAEFISMPVPIVWAWWPGQAAPVQLAATQVQLHEAVPTDYTLHEAVGTIQVTLPVTTEVKIYLEPGV